MGLTGPASRPLRFALMLAALRRTCRALHPAKPPAAVGSPEHHRVSYVAGESVTQLPVGAAPLWVYDLDGATHGIPRAHEWTRIIDVRSPSEFALDCIPGAINCPVLDDAERAEVGTLYARASKFEARVRGARLVALNLAKMLEDERVSSLPKDARVLVYCWRGGERSAAVAHTLSRIGWHTARLSGGYKRYREAVRTHLEDPAKIHGEITWHAIDGPTGSGKGLVLDALEERALDAAETVGGAAFGVVDLEGLARHRGSALGDLVSVRGDAVVAEAQPNQKAFESALVERLFQLQERRPAGAASTRVFVEAESSLIGRVTVPALIIDAIAATKDATYIELPLAGRVKHLRAQYAAFETVHGAPELKRRLAGLARQAHLGAKALARWEACIDEGRWDDLVTDLLEVHYDPAYDRCRARNVRPQQFVRLPLEDLSPKSLAQAAIGLTAHDAEEAAQIYAAVLAGEATVADSDERRGVETADSGR
ncbi:hypothetical protein M885DRAFT_460699 [Pelagophyceae sp. CCMP2097]|nr:hypothetical protein M885DRAFT_460699 [Pelagophyceae sp. CCMP2097]